MPKADTQYKKMCLKMMNIFLFFQQQRSISSRLDEKMLLVTIVPADFHTKTANEVSKKTFQQRKNIFHQDF